MSVLIKGGTIVTANDTYQADILVKDGVIDCIGHGLSAADAEVIDARGRYVLPGAIDVHVHTMLRFGGFNSSDDFATSTTAAACGGTTTIIDYAFQSPGRRLQSVLERWRLRAEGAAVIDFGFHIAITDFSLPDILDEMPALMEAGVTSFKLFLGYRGLGVTCDDTALLRTLWKAKDCGALICLHCENADMIHALTQRALADGQTAPKYFALSRHPMTEAEATSRAIDAAAIADVPIYIVHLSAAEALQRVRYARERGQTVFVETCPQYLVLSHNDLVQPGLDDARYVTFPPLRSKASQDALWNGLAAGEIQVVATDHCAYGLRDKIVPAEEHFARIPGGLPSVETRLQLLYTAGVVDGRLDLNRLVAVNATNPAKLFGLFPRKGTVAVGSDADLVIYDPAIERTITAAALHHPVDYTPFEGFRCKGWPELVLSRGRVVARSGDFVGDAGAGRYLKRERGAQSPLA